jgi:hypothetical protein
VLFPTYLLYGIGFGLCLPQITNIVLADVDTDKAGAAGGANNTAKQMGVSLGVAVIGALLSSRTIAAGLDRLDSVTGLSAATRAEAAASLRASGVSFVPPPRATTAEVGILRRLFVDALASGAKWPLVFSCITGVVAFVVSLMIPKARPLNELAEVDEQARLAAAH